MKKIFGLTVALFSLLMASCQNENFEQQTDDRVPVSFVVNIPQDMSATRGIRDNVYGTGEKINRCILQVYDGETPYGEKHVVAVADSKAKFLNLRFETGKSYKFAFWADCSGENMADKYYDTSDLKAVAYKDNYVGNNIEFDAFTAVKEYEISNELVIEDIVLTRPFGLLKIKTTDLNSTKVEKLLPKKVNTSLAGVPNNFNVLDGSASLETRSLAYAADVVDEKGLMTVDYIFANNDGTMVNASMTFINAEGAEITKNDKMLNLPVRRNYITNVSGALLTIGGNLDITLSPDFASEDKNSQL